MNDIIAGFFQHIAAFIILCILVGAVIGVNWLNDRANDRDQQEWEEKIRQIEERDR